MAQHKDMTMDIPLTKVTSSKKSGARRADTVSPSTSQPPVDFPDSLNEKHPRFHRAPGGRRRKITQQGKENKSGDDGSLTAAGKLYMRIYNFSIITRYFVYVAPLAIAIAVPIVIGATIAPRARIGGVKMVWFFTWIEILWVSLWISKLVARFLPLLFQFLCGVVSAGTRKYALVITSLEIPLSLVGWAVTSLTTFVPLMTLNPDARARSATALTDWMSIVKNILFACLFSTLVLLGEKLLIQLLSISYHRKQFDDRIKASKRDIYLVSLLYDASRSLFPAYSPEFAEEDYLISDVLDIAGGSRPLSRPGHKRSGSATPMRILQNAARVGDKITAAFGHVAQEVTGKHVFDRTSAHSVVVEAMEKKHSSEALARRLWMSFVLEGRDALYLEDIVDVLGHEREADAEEAFECLDADANGDISLDEMILRINEFGRERYSIANSMHDVDQAIHVLDNLLMTVVFLMVIFIFVAWLNKNFTTTLATTGTALLSLSFVFSVTAQEVLGSCIFLFVKHPYDVGDRVDINSVQLVVERISLLYTVFRRVNDHKRTQSPNIVLNSLWIDNITRSKAMREQVLLYIHFDTTLEDLELLKKEMINFVRDKDNARDFQPDVDIEVTGLAEMNKMELKIEIRHKSNWSNEALRATRRSKFMCALVLAMRKVPIYGPGAGGAAAGEPANPTYSVAISDEQAAVNKAKFDEDKNKKRLVPQLPSPISSNDDTAVGRSTSIDFFAENTDSKERAFMDDINKRDLASDPVRDEPERNHEVDAAAERHRSNAIEQVSQMLRRTSTVGRRKATQHDALAPHSARHHRAPTVPTISEPGPLPYLTPPQPSTRDGSHRVGFTDDTSYRTASAQEQGQYPAQSSQTQSSSITDRPIRRDSDPTERDSPSRYVPGNAFSQQQFTGPQTQQGRQPVPGIGGMKGTLLQGPPSTQR